MNLPTLRITVIGPGGSGKTSLINAFVNNSCPLVHAPTTQQTLYYRALRAQESESEQLMNVLLEIEDSPPAFTGEKQGDYERTWLRKESKSASRSGQRGTFADVDWIPLHGEGKSLKPITKMRMAYILVFDVNDKESYDAVWKMFDILKNYDKVGESRSTTGVVATSSTQSSPQPLVWIVANKIDQDPEGEAWRNYRSQLLGQKNRLMKMRETSQELLTFDIESVSAFEYTRVRRLFRSIVSRLIEDPMYTDIWQGSQDKADDDEDGQATGFLGFGASTIFGGAPTIFGSGGWFG
jgi:GTPase SAR1 family protein